MIRNTKLVLYSLDVSKCTSEVSELYDENEIEKKLAAKGVMMGRNNGVCIIIL